MDVCHRCSRKCDERDLEQCDTCGADNLCFDCLYLHGCHLIEGDVSLDEDDTIVQAMSTGMERLNRPEGWPNEEDE